VNLVRELNKSWGEIELSPLLKSQVKVGFVVLDLYEQCIWIDGANLELTEIS
jgi:hypothetical protein